MNERPTPWALFSTFFAIALSGFGGTLPFARRILVERRAWLTPEDFTETLSLCQTLPGPNVVNMSVVVGARACGWRGSLAAFAGLVGTPVIIVITLGLLYKPLRRLEADLPDAIPDAVILDKDLIQQQADAALIRRHPETQTR